MSSSDLRKTSDFLSARNAWEKRCKEEEERLTVLNRQLSGALVLSSTSPLSSARGVPKNNLSDRNDIVTQVLVSLEKKDLVILNSALRDPKSVATLIAFRSNEGDTVLHVMVREGYHAAARLFLQHLPFSGSKQEVVDFINCPNTWKDTALHLSLSDTDSEIALLLLNSGADPYRKNQNNDTALYLACGIGWLDVVWKMLQHEGTTSATISFSSSDGLTAAQMAEQHGHRSIAQLLKETKAKLS